MLQAKTQDRATSKELKNLIKKCDIDKDVIIEENDEPLPIAKKIDNNQKKKYKNTYLYNNTSLAGPSLNDGLPKLVV